MNNINKLQQRLKFTTCKGVELVQTKSHQEARLIHYRNGTVIEASTKERAISDQLYSNTDTCASMNLGRILAARCLQAGIYFATPGASEEQIEISKHQKEFFKVLQDEGLQLKEPAAFEQTYETDRSMTWERYPLMANRQDKLDEL
ncbi:39S ribosomal protein L18 mitochondrial [Trichostrongylus colubriformis]|uniref:39S ribosomal protein L18 mitochondrial n=1 Tax=Trichostrongylus colubriformis TaxID=6319 RepID=A0AAN8FHT1_TRICO